VAKQVKNKYKDMILVGPPIKPVYLEENIFCNTCYKRINKGESIIDVKGKFVACLSCGSKRPKKDEK